MEKIWVRLKEKPYPIFIGRDILKDLGDYLKSLKIGGSLFIITDNKVKGLYGNGLVRNLKDNGFSDIKVSSFPEGEESKNIETYLNLIEDLHKFKGERAKRLSILNLGGGVVGDIGGFVASTYRRGVPYIQIPTTLLAQVDASIGGKTGIDYRNAKNMIGSFYQPEMVYVDLDTLKTLPEEEIKNGLAEVVKYGMIKDREFFDYLEKNSSSLPSLNPEITERVVLTSARIKAEIVQKDEKEKKGIREDLNFGHTIGHSLEAVTKYGLRHGEAISLGMVGACRLASYLNLFKEEGGKRLEKLLKKIGLPVKTDKIDLEKAFHFLMYDKKFREKNRFVLPLRIGKVKIVEGIEESLIKKSLLSLFN